MSRHLRRAEASEAVSVAAKAPSAYCRSPCANMDWQKGRLGFNLVPCLCQLRAKLNCNVSPQHVVLTAA